jgi:hypothetical protein
MVLLSQLIRTAAITGRTDNLGEWFAGRQGGRWAEQMVQSAVPSARGRDSAETLRELTELHQRGVFTDAEFEGLRARLRV